VSTGVQSVPSYWTPPVPSLPRRPMSWKPMFVTVTPSAIGTEKDRIASSEFWF